MKLGDDEVTNCLHVGIRIINATQVLRNFGIMIEEKPMKVKGKVLPAPKLEYGSARCANNLTLIVRL